jgi:hypothetical protein
MPSNDAQGQLEGDAADVWNRLIGPVYDPAGLEKAFGLWPGMIDAMARSRFIVKLETSDGTSVVPAFCFNDSGEVLPYLPLVISRLLAREFMNEWSVAIWLNDHADEWDGRSAVELLRTEWADEVATQAGEHGRSPLRARAEQANR